MALMVVVAEGAAPDEESAQGLVAARRVVLARQSAARALAFLEISCRPCAEPPMQPAAIPAAAEPAESVAQLELQRWLEGS